MKINVILMPIKMVVLGKVHNSKSTYTLYEILTFSTINQIVPKEVLISTFLPFERPQVLDDELSLSFFHHLLSSSPFDFFKNIVNCFLEKTPSNKCSVNTFKYEGFTVGDKSIYDNSHLSMVEMLKARISTRHYVKCKLIASNGTKMAK